MIEKQYKCKLLSELVLNASPATEGNMESLDYISGSNFLGIVANQVYENHKEKAKDILHSNKVLFGDGIISKKGKQFYAMPFCFLQDKLNGDFPKDPIYLDYNVDHLEGIEKDGRKLQLKQKRQGYISVDGDYLSEVPKNFSLKSAYDREERRSAEGKMFGMEAIEAGEEFWFSIYYKDESLIEIVEEYLLGRKRIGKSKTAEYGQVKISLNEPQKNEIISEVFGDYTIVYAESNLCFFDEHTGQTTFHPTEKQLGIESGEIDWSKSQIRTFSYSPWNRKRNASSMQRHCITKGSVFYIKDGKTDESKNTVGDFTNEGLGRVIYNPSFLKPKSEYKQLLDLKFTQINKIEEEKNLEPIKYLNVEENSLNTGLAKFLLNKAKDEENELQLAEEINYYLIENKKSDLVTKITSSQWGNIRTEATEYLQEGKDFNEFLFKLGLGQDKNPKGILTHGKMSERLWNNKRRGDLKNIFESIQTPKKLEFAAKFSAEMAKEAIRNQNKKEKDEHKK